MFYGNLSGFAPYIPGNDPTLGFLNDIQVAGLDGDLICCLDAGAAGSYDGSSQTWTDLTGNVDAWRGNDSSSASDDPTFNGTSGDLSSSEYFSTDGGDHFSFKSSPANIDDIHQDGADYTLAMWIYVVTGTNCHPITGNAGASGTGFRLQMNGSNNRYELRVLNSGAQPNSGHGNPTTTFNLSAWNFFGITVDEATGSGGGFHYLNGVYNQVSGSDTFDASYTSPSTGTATNDIDIFAKGAGAQHMISGFRIAGYFLWSGGHMTKLNMDTLWAAQKGRFGL